MSTTKIANQTVAVWTSELSGGRVYVHDAGCPWVTTQAEWAGALEVLADDEYATSSDAYQALCDRIQPIASANEAVDVRDADEQWHAMLAEASDTTTLRGETVIVTSRNAAGGIESYLSLGADGRVWCNEEGSRVKLATETTLDDVLSA